MTTAKTPGRCYGLDSSVLAELRARRQKWLAGRLGAGEMQVRVIDHLRAHGRSTIRQVAGAVDMSLADTRQAIARLINLNLAVRDGLLWEDSVQSGQRDAAAYRASEVK